MGRYFFGMVVIIIGLTKYEYYRLISVRGTAPFVHVLWGKNKIGTCERMYASGWHSYRMRVGNDGGGLKQKNPPLRNDPHRPIFMIYMH